MSSVNTLFANLMIADRKFVSCLLDRVNLELANAALFHFAV